MPENRTLGGRKPVHLQAAAGFLTVREQIWAAIRARPQRFTRADIVHETKASDGTVRSYMEQLLAGDYLRALEHRPRSEHGGQRFRYTPYALVRDVGVEAPRLRPDGSPATGGMSREKMWRAIKILPEFDALEVQDVASADGHRVDLQDAKQYLCALARAGYLVVASPARSGRGRTLARYRFVKSRNTGPRPPMVQRSRAVFDANEGRIVWPAQPEASA